MRHWKRRRGGFWFGVSCPQSISSSLTALPPLANTCGIYNQIEFLRLPTSLSSRPGGHVLFPTGTIILLPSLCPSLGWRTRRHTQGFTHQARNDGQQSLSFLHIEKSPVRQALLQNRIALAIITALQGGSSAIIQTECCVLIPVKLFTCHFY